jgi:hypothetical protein
LRLFGDRAADAQKNELKPWLVKMWCIPPKANAEFVWRMEDVLETYKLPYDPRFPQVCMDEASKQLVGKYGNRRRFNRGRCGGRTANTSGRGRAISSCSSSRCVVGVMCG